MLAQNAVNHLDTQTNITRVFVDSLGKTTSGVLCRVLKELPRGPDDVAQTLPTMDVCRQLKVITDEVADVAREGIQSLGAAAKLAHERGHRRIRDRDVGDSYEWAKRRIRRLNL